MGRRRSNKQPSRKVAVDTSKRPHIARSPDFLSKQPRWGFGHVDMVSHFGWVNLNGPAAESIVGRLKQWESMSWKEILGKSSHFIDVPRCSKEARDRLRHLQLEDVDRLLSLRIGSRERVIGIVRGEVFHFLWWDPDHRVCPGTKKR